MWADVVKKKICLWSGKGTFLVSEGNTALSIVDSGLERMNEGAVANGENLEPLGVGGRRDWHLCPPWSLVDILEVESAAW